jgi:cytosine/adenosine deaminase-related metal-dependent hydrolase
VAIRAAKTLRTMGDAGVTALRTSADRHGLAGDLARHALWKSPTRTPSRG